MNASISVATYSIFAKRPRGDVHSDLSNLRGVDLFSLVRDFLRDRSFVKDSETKTVLKASDVIANEEHRLISGYFKSGNYGYAADIHSTIDDTVSYEKKETDAELIPFFFLIYLPKNKSRGLILLQRYGIYGIYSPFHRLLREEFVKSLPEEVLKMEQIVHPDLITKFAQEGRTKKIRFRKNTIPQDSADQLNINPSNAFIEYSIVAKRNSILGTAADLLNIPANLGKLIFSEEFAPDETLLDVKLNGKTRTLHVGNTGHIQSYFDITNELTILPSGHPQLESLKRAFDKLKDDLWKVLEGVEDEDLEE